MKTFSERIDRRQQVLTAAAACFREHGFHATSIQRICQAAGMSPGHIYHYFANKDAIVAGIVDLYLQESLESVRQIEKDSVSVGLVEAVMGQVKASIALRSERERSSLALEIMAEASRNTVIAEAVQSADAAVREKIQGLLLHIPGFVGLDASERNARICVMSTLIDGLSVRALCDPLMDARATTQVIEKTMRSLLQVG